MARGEMGTNVLVLLLVVSRLLSIGDAMVASSSRRIIRQNEEDTENDAWNCFVVNSPSSITHTNNRTVDTLLCRHFFFFFFFFFVVVIVLVLELVPCTFKNTVTLVVPYVVLFLSLSLSPLSLSLSRYYCKNDDNNFQKK